MTCWKKGGNGEGYSAWVSPNLTYIQCSQAFQHLVKSYAISSKTSHSTHTCTALSKNLSHSYTRSKSLTVMIMITLTAGFTMSKESKRHVATVMSSDK